MFAKIVGVALLLLSGLAYSACDRLISLDPSATDGLLQLGLRDRLVAVDRYSALASGDTLPQVGDFTGIDLERILLLRADTIVLSQKSLENQRLIDQGVSFIQISNRTLVDLWQGLRAVSEHCHVTPRYNGLFMQWNQEWAQLKKINNHQSALLIFTGSEGSDSVFYVAGKGLYSELLAHLGFNNAYQGTLTTAPLSFEGVLSLKPDVIISLDLNAQQALALIDTQSIWSAYGIKVVRVSGASVHRVSPLGLIGLAKQISDTLSK